VYLALTGMGAQLGGKIFSLTHASSISKTVNKPELLEHFLTGDSSKDSIGTLVKENSYARRLRKGQPSRIRAHPGPMTLSLAGRNTCPHSSPRSENLGMLGEKASTLALKSITISRSAAAKKGTRKGRLTDAPGRDSPGSQPKQGPSKGRPPSLSSQTQILQEPGTSGIQTKGRKNYCSAGLVRLGLEFLKVRKEPSW